MLVCHPGHTACCGLAYPCKGNVKIRIHESELMISKQTAGYICTSKEATPSVLCPLYVPLFWIRLDYFTYYVLRILLERGLPNYSLQLHMFCFTFILYYSVFLRFHKQNPHEG